MMMVGNLVGILDSLICDFQPFLNINCGLAITIILLYNVTTPSNGFLNSKLLFTGSP